MIAKVSMDFFQGKKIFFVRFYENVNKLVEQKVLDIYECSSVMIDPDVITFVEYENEMEDAHGNTRKD
jgi:hypothetical protein